MEKVKLVQFQVVSELVLKEGARTCNNSYHESDFRQLNVIYALDNAGNLWKKVREEWQYIPNPNDNEN